MLLESRGTEVLLLNSWHFPPWMGLVTPQERGISGEELRIEGKQAPPILKWELLWEACSSSLARILWGRGWAADPPHPSLHESSGEGSALMPGVEGPGVGEGADLCCQSFFG